LDHRDKPGGSLSDYIMQTYDMLMLVVLFGATVFGFWKGMAWQIASLAALVVSYFASLRFADQLAPIFGQQAPTNKFVAMAAIYVGTSFIIWMLFRFVAGAIDKIKLESFDRQLGGIFGFAKGVLLCIGITFFAVMLWPAQRDAIVGSQSGHYIVALLDKAHSVLPPEIHQAIDPYLNKIEERLNPNFQPHAELDVRQQWPSQSQTAAPTGWPTSSGAPQAQPPQQLPAWPASSQSQPAWPTQPQQAQQSSDQNPYNVQREPNPYPGPYSAEVKTSRDY
jgi:membrane protein required for colicin V production